MTIRHRVDELERQAGPAGLLSLAQLDGADRARYRRMARHTDAQAFFRTLPDADLDRSINILRRVTGNEFQA